MVGDRLKHYRNLRRMSQEDLAEMMGFPPNTISKIEHDTRKVTLEEAVRFAEVLRISLHELAGVPESSGQNDVVTKVQLYTQKMRDATTSIMDDLERTVATY